MRIVALTWAAVAALVLSASALAAHEGHDHRIMGTVSAIHGTQLQLKTTEGKEATIALNGSTKVMRGTDVVGTTDIKAGERVVVTARQAKDKTGTVSWVASEVRLGASSPSAGR
jgi:hypothetical protein